MLRWPVSAGRAIARLFQALQDIDIFVEDQNDEEFYTQLFSTAAGGAPKISRVVGLGGRLKVEDAAQNYNDARPALFLTDGDLSWVRGEAPLVVPRLYRLNCYCIENVLIASGAAAEVLAEEKVCSDTEAHTTLKFKEWCDEMNGLVDLSILFAVLNKIDSTVTTVNGALSAVLVAASGGLPSVCKNKLAAEIVRVRAEIDQRIGGTAADLAIDAVKRRVTGLEKPLAAVSGKEFLLPLLAFHIKYLSYSNVKPNVFRFRLAKKVKQGDLKELTQALKVAS